MSSPQIIMIEPLRRPCSISAGVVSAVIVGKLIQKFPLSQTILSERFLMSEQHPTRAPKQLSDTPAQTHTQFTDIKPLTSTMPARRTQAGRPKKLVMPDLPEMKMTDIEQNLFEFFMAAYEQEYPDLTPTDHLILHLAGLKYIQYL